MRLLFHSLHAPAVVMLVALACLPRAFCAEIHDAAKNGDLAKVKALLKDDPVVAASSKQNDGWTSLYWASLNGHKEIAELLPTYKANVDARNNLGATPVGVATASGHKDVADLLRRHGGAAAASVRVAQVTAPASSKTSANGPKPASPSASIAAPRAVDVQITNNLSNDIEVGRAFYDLVRLKPLESTALHLTEHAADKGIVRIAFCTHPWKTYNDDCIFTPVAFEVKKLSLKVVQEMNGEMMVQQVTPTSGAPKVTARAPTTASAARKRTGAAEPKTEEYAILEDPGEIGLDIDESELTYIADTGRIVGRIKKVTVGGKPLELVCNNIVNDENGYWIVTKAYGRIRISSRGFLKKSAVWLTPSQKARLKAVFLENQ